MFRIQENPDNPSCATLTATKAEHRFGNLIQHHLLTYKGDLGKVAFCGVQPFDEDHDHIVSWTLEVLWNDDKSNFPVLLTSVINDIKSTFVALRSEYKKR